MGLESEAKTCSVSNRGKLRVKVPSRGIVHAIVWSFGHSARVIYQSQGGLKCKVSRQTIACRFIPLDLTSSCKREGGNVICMKGSAVTEIVKMARFGRQRIISERHSSSSWPLHIDTSIMSRIAISSRLVHQPSGCPSSELLAFSQDRLKVSRSFGSVRPLEMSRYSYSKGSARECHSLHTRTMCRFVIYI